jgi:hypothetical protein
MVGIMSSIDDTLFEDGSGHAADLFESVEEGGMPFVVELLTAPESEWDMGIAGWGGAQLLAVEVLAAAAGKPSQSSECHHIREWGEQNPAELDSAVVEAMLGVIDRIMAKLQSNPEIFELDVAYVGAVLRVGTLMRQRVEGLM